jgi:hypothetical protein
LGKSILIVNRRKYEFAIAIFLRDISASDSDLNKNSLPEGACRRLFFECMQHLSYGHIENAYPLPEVTTLAESLFK